MKPTIESQMLKLKKSKMRKRQRATTSDAVAVATESKKKSSATRNAGAVTPLAPTEVVADDRVLICTADS